MRSTNRDALELPSSRSHAKGARAVVTRCTWIGAAVAAALASAAACGHGTGGGVGPDTDAGSGAAAPDGGTVQATEAGALATPTDAGASIVMSGDAATTASPLSFGQNYWSWVSQYGDQVDQVEDGAATLGIKLLRAGGHNNDNNTPEAFTPDHIDTFVAYARAIGAEPVLQVPLLLDGDGGRPTPQTAADMVTYANVTKSYGIKYWEIGNEPDLYSDQGDLDAGYTAASYCTDFAAMGDAMRAVDPTISILGPELSYKYVVGNDWLTPFLAACGSKVDVVTVHRYPFAPTALTIANAMNDGAQFRATLVRLRQIIDAAGLTSVPLAITESNFTYNGDPTLQTQPASLGTFYAGLWAADVAGVALEQHLWTMAFWSIDEGFDTGFFTSDTFAPRPAAYAYQLIATHFGPTILQAATVPTGLSAYASRDDTNKKTVALVINRTATASAQVLGFTGLAVSVPNLAVDVPPYTLLLVEIPDVGAPAIWSYTKALADQGLPPQKQ